MKHNIIPKPEYCEIIQDKTGFTLHNGCSLDDQTATAGIFDVLTRFLSLKFGYVPIGGDEDGVYLSFSPALKKSGEYTLECRDGKAVVAASDAAGLFYALVTLIQLLNSYDGTIPCLTVKDSPRFPVRSFTLDVSRHFFTVECVKLFIDVMALHKLNRLYLHLTDDQGWRLESEEYPLLTLIGSQRSYTAFDKIPHKGFFSIDDIREIVKYAASNYIKVVPEISMPGHCTAAVCAYPFLSCSGKETDVSTSFGVKKTVMCPGKESTYEFVTHLLDETARLFRDTEIRIDCGDIAFDSVNNCPQCKKKMAENGLNTNRELFSYFLKRISENRPGIIFTRADSHLSDNLPHCAAPVPFQYILSGTYGKNNLKSCYMYSPKPSASEAEAVLYSEYVYSLEKAGYLMLPRLAAFSESAWTDEKNKDYGSFLTALDNFFSLSELYGMPHATLRQAMPSFVRKVGYGMYHRVVKALSES